MVTTFATRLPQKAGIATIRVEEARGKETPHIRREESTIIFHNDPHSEFIVLRNGEQFLFKESRGDELHWYFGGTDGTRCIFLVKIDCQESNPNPINAYHNEGEQGFFNSLKPEIIRKLEKNIGHLTKRQGDQFAFPLPYPLESIRNTKFLWTGIPHDEKSWWVATKYDLLYKTRRKLEGNVHVVKTTLLGESVTIAEGTFTSPNHDPMILERPHIIARAVGMHRND